MNRQDELFLIKSIAERLNKETTLNNMLQGVLEQLLELTGLKAGWIFLTGPGRSFELAASSHLPQALSCEDRRYMRTGGCYCLNQCFDGSLTEASNIIECKRIEDAIEQKRGDIGGITHHASVPLKSGTETFGLLNVASPAKKTFSSEELMILESVSLQIGTAWERIRLAEREKDSLVLEERNRLARDLHDSVNQQLFSIMFTAKGLERNVTDPAVSTGLKEVHTMTKEALAQMKTLIWQLRPDSIPEGLQRRITAYGKEQDLHVSCRTIPAQLPPHVQNGFWKIAREALNNIRKHAGTREAEVTLDETKEQYIMTITDRGKGFPEGQADSGCLGLISMRERAVLLNGLMSIESTPGIGTSITVTAGKEENEYG
ncbi:GAF domain-containing sensor histidine kinase [Alteribacter natronophilus]|uniref:GAF domain-containing sensor histidine kinase n=1 Tax=Alteribacter natronophilus TaxID=2583810 RepID=UPI00110F29C6|nr:GAF domain-containing sensor histidine kinase [Alteribacter natronophilus]TMW70303.1 GAF domain-containing sensor histidine kinase [Alteribacter natronophilus]